MRGNLQALRIVCLGALLSFSFFLLLCLLPTRAELAENNFQANLIRLQAFLFDAPPRTVLVGSSMTGRLLPRYFADTPLAPVVNLGLDGSGAGLGLELALRRPPPILVVEVNLLLKPRDSNDALLEDVSQSFAFRLSRRVPIMRAHARPSSLLYSWLKTGSNRGQPAQAVPLTASTNESVTNNSSAPLGVSPAMEKIRAQILALQAAGSRIVFLRLPAGKNTLDSQHPAARFADQLAKEFNLSQIDLTADFGAKNQPISYSDGVHLTPASAREASRFLANHLISLGLLPGPGNIQKANSFGVLADKLRPKP